MDIKLISKEKVLKLIDVLVKNTKVLAPQKDAFGDIYFKEVKNSKDIFLKPFKPLMPTVRELLFGQTKEMIKYKKEQKGTKFEEIKEARPAIIFGLPSCDINGISYNDVFFMKREFCDPYYKEARDNLTLISMVCDIPPNSTCFCGTMTSGPHAKKGYDLQLTPLGEDNFLVEIGSDKGKEMVESNSNLFMDPSDKDIDLVHKIWNLAKERATAKKVNKEKTLEKMSREPVKEALMIEVSNRCISCGACNYTCPTCTCFSVFDWGKNEGVRKRVLDSCIFSGYFRMAGGHNPKEKHELRTKQRYYCKLLWDKEKYNDSGCVGCGRCLDSCPVDIDIKEVMTAIAS